MLALSAKSPDTIEPQAVGAPHAARSLTMRGNTVDSRDLLATEREIIIQHGADSYRLRLTSQNKLILTK